MSAGQANIEHMKANIERPTSNVQRPTPYYQDKSVTIYHGDCREVMRGMDRVDVAIERNEAYCELAVERLRQEVLL